MRIRNKKTRDDNAATLSGHGKGSLEVTPSNTRTKSFRERARSLSRGRSLSRTKQSANDSPKVSRSEGKDKGRSQSRGRSRERRRSRSRGSSRSLSTGRSSRSSFSLGELAGTSHSKEVDFPVDPTTRIKVGTSDDSSPTPFCSRVDGCISALCSAGTARDQSETIGKAKKSFVQKMIDGDIDPCDIIPNCAGSFQNHTPSKANDTGRSQTPPRSSRSSTKKEEGSPRSVAADLSSTPPPNTSPDWVNGRANLEISDRKRSGFSPYSPDMVPSPIDARNSKRGGIGSSKKGKGPPNDMKNQSSAKKGNGLFGSFRKGKGKKKGGAKAAKSAYV